jgi:WD40 repeat protein
MWIWMNPAGTLLLALAVIALSVFPAGASGVDTGRPENPAPFYIWADQIDHSGVQVSITGDGNFIAAGTGSGIIRLYDNRGHTLWTRHTDNGAPVTELKISRTGDFIGVVTAHPYDREILCLDRNGRVVKNISAGPDTRIALSGDGELMVATQGRNLSFFYPSTGLVKVIQGNRSAIWDQDIITVAVSDNGRYVAAGTRLTYNSPDGNMVIHNPWVYLFTAEGDPVWSAETHAPIGNLGLQISREGDIVIVQDYRRITMMNATGEPGTSYTNNGEMRGYAIRSSDAGDYTVGFSNARVFFLDRSATKIWEHFVTNIGDLRRDEDVTGISISGDGMYAAATGGNRELFVWNRTGQLLWHYPLTTGGQAEFSRNGNYLAVGTGDGIMLFNTLGTSEQPEPAGTGMPLATPGAPLPSPTVTAPVSGFCCLTALGLASLLPGLRAGKK